MRKWLDQARVSGQPVDGTARDGTFGAGCHRITGLMHTLISDMVQLRLEGQKVRIKCCSFEAPSTTILCVFAHLITVSIWAGMPFALHPFIYLLPENVRVNA